MAILTLYQGCRFPVDNSDVCENWGAYLNNLLSRTINITRERIPPVDGETITVQRETGANANNIYNYAVYHDENYMEAAENLCFFVTQRFASADMLYLDLTLDVWASAGRNYQTRITASATVVKSHLPIDTATVNKNMGGWLNTRPVFGAPDDVFPVNIISGEVNPETNPDVLLCMCFLCDANKHPVMVYYRTTLANAQLLASYEIKKLWVTPSPSGASPGAGDLVRDVVGVQGKWIVPCNFNDLPDAAGWCVRLGNGETYFDAEFLTISEYPYKNSFASITEKYITIADENDYSFCGITIGTPAHRIEWPVICMKGKIKYRYILIVSQMDICATLESGGNLIELTSDFAVPYHMTDENAQTLQNEANKNIRLISAGLGAAGAVAGAFVTGGSLAPVAASAIGTAASQIAQVYADKSSAAFAPSRINVNGNANTTFTASPTGICIFLAMPLNMTELYTEYSETGVQCNIELDNNPLVPDQNSYLYCYFQCSRISVDQQQTVSTIYLLRAGYAEMLARIFQNGVRIWKTPSVFLRGWR